MDGLPLEVMQHLPEFMDCQQTSVSNVLRLMPASPSDHLCSRHMPPPTDVVHDEAVGAELDDAHLRRSGHHDVWCLVQERQRAHWLMLSSPETLSWSHTS